MNITKSVRLLALTLALDLVSAAGRAAATDTDLSIAETQAGAALAGDLAPHAGESIHTHEPLEIDPALTLATALDAAIAIYPSRFEVAVRQEMASAWRRQGESLLSAAPTIGFSMLSDSPLDNRGQSELEAGIDLPLWRPGQKEAARSVADSASAASLAAQSAMRLELAGSIRSILWEIAGAAQAVEQAEAALALTEELVRVVEMRVERGDLPRADVLLARASAYERRVAVVEHEAMLLDAERSYRALTGLTARPAAYTESRSGREDYDAGHPQLTLARLEVERALAEQDYTDKSSRGHPTLSIGPRRQRDALTSFYNESLSVGISMPFGGASHGAVARAEASTAVASARGRLARVERQLDLELHEAEHELFVIEESLELVVEQAALAERRLVLGRSAFAQGEIELQDLLRIQDAAISATGAEAGLRIERQRAIAALNQALGELP